MIESAIETDQLEMVQLLCTKGTRQSSFNLLAVARGRVSILEWLHQQGPFNLNAELEEALEMGRLEIIKMLDCWREQDYYIKIAHSEHFSHVEWLYRQDPSRKAEIAAHVYYPIFAKYLQMKIDH